jgi:hypothetical protein
MNLLRSGVAPGVQYEVERLLRSENAKDPFHQVHLITEALKQPDYDPKAVAEMFRALKKKASESYVWGASNCLLGAVRYALPFSNSTVWNLKDTMIDDLAKRPDLAWAACRAIHTILVAANLDIDKVIFPRRTSVAGRMNLQQDPEVAGSFRALISELEKMEEIDVADLQELFRKFPMVCTPAMQTALLAVQNALGPLYETTFETACCNVEEQYTAKLTELIRPVAHKPWDPHSWTSAQETEYRQACLLHNTCMVGLDEGQTVPLLRLRHAMIDVMKQVKEAKAAEAGTVGLFGKDHSGKQRRVAIIVRKASSVTLDDGSVLRVPPVNIYVSDDDDELQAHLIPERKKNDIVVVRVSSGFACKVSDCPDVDAIVRFMVELGSGRIDEQRMTFTGSCLWCGRELSATSSVQRSAGDTCFKAYGSPLLMQIASFASLPATTGDMMRLLGGVSDADLLRKFVTEDVKSDVLDTLRELYGNDDDEEDRNEKEEMAWSALANIAGVQGGAAAMRRAATDVARVVATEGKWIPPPQQGRFAEATKASEHLDGAGGRLLADWLARRIMQEPIPSYLFRDDNETLASRLKRMRSQREVLDPDDEEPLAARAKRIGPAHGK